MDEAVKAAATPPNIRRANQREGNPYAAIYVFRDRHGRVLTLRYSGKSRARPRACCRTPWATASSANQSEAGGHPGRAGGRRSRPGPDNSDCSPISANDGRIRLRRWANCELYGGEASGLPMNLTRAARLYHASRTASSDYGVGVDMACKLFIVEALHGRKEEAAKVLAALDADPREIVGSDRERAGLLTGSPRPSSNSSRKVRPKGRRRFERSCNKPL